MSDLLKEHLGTSVEVRTQLGNYDYSDQGVLLAFDDRWVQLQKETGEIIFFPIANIRLLKLLEY